jgi:hypothetical protein
MDFPWPVAGIPLPFFKREKVTGGWRKFHNLYSRSNVIRSIKLRKISSVGHVDRVGGNRNGHKILVGKH